MDTFLLDYLHSGKAWVLVGSGPSIAMGYPNWEQLASLIIATVRTEYPDSNTLVSLQSSLKKQDYPTIFQIATKVLGIPKTLQVLENSMHPSKSGFIYEMICNWPIPVFLTTNYDNEIQAHLAKLKFLYQEYTNSEDHFGYLTQELTNAVFKIHGDLRSKTGLILTSSDYDDIEKGDKWEYWRNKMMSICQMNRLIILGHSLSDRNVKHVLAAARKGAGVNQPICWIAPDVSFDQSRYYLETYRIRIISYDNRDGSHSNLTHLIERISDFIPPRATVKMKEHLKDILQPSVQSPSAAPGFYVFNSLSTLDSNDDKRIGVITAAIQSVLPKLANLKNFTIEQALFIAGWPEKIQIDSSLLNQIREALFKQGILILESNALGVNPSALEVVGKEREKFEHLRTRFLSSMILRIRRDYPALSEDDAKEISSSIERSLIGYFRDCGLTLTTTLITRKFSANRSNIPVSLIKFITNTSIQYDDLLKRQAFWTTSVDIFVRSELIEREFLGRISQGFFAFHLLGVFGDVALERFRHAVNTVWLVDSNLQILILAIGAPSNVVFRNSFLRLKQMGIRFFTTYSLLKEAWNHFHFAKQVILNNGPDSPYVIHAATGQTPYRQTNQFLEGFIRWRAAGNPSNWESYVYQVFDTINPNDEAMITKLQNLGIEVVNLENWPGFRDEDFSGCDTYTSIIKQIREEKQQIIEFEESDSEILQKKAGPEAEALIIVLNERNGQYHILSKAKEKSPAWFLSHTSLLNLVELDQDRITWQPEAFLRFAGSLLPPLDSSNADRAFEIILWGIAQSGLNILEESVIREAFVGIIDQAAISLQEQRQIYEKTLSKKYGESPDKVLARLSPSQRPIAAIQLMKEMTQSESERADKESKLRKSTEKRLEDSEKRNIVLETKLKRKKRYDKMMKKIQDNKKNR